MSSFAKAVLYNKDLSNKILSYLPIRPKCYLHHPVKHIPQTEILFFEMIKLKNINTIIMEFDRKKLIKFSLINNDTIYKHDYHDTNKTYNVIILLISLTDFLPNLTTIFFRSHQVDFLKDISKTVLHYISKKTLQRIKFITDCDGNFTLIK